MEEIHNKRHFFLSHSFYDIYTNDNILFDLAMRNFSQILIYLKKIWKL